MWTMSRSSAVPDEQECRGKDPQLHWMGKGKRLRTIMENKVGDGRSNQQGRRIRRDVPKLQVRDREVATHIYGVPVMA